LFRAARLLLNGLIIDIEGTNMWKSKQCADIHTKREVIKGQGLQGPNIR
jgi:hypothetical protein